MRKLLLSVVLCSALVMGLLPAAAFAMELGNAPESVEKAPTSALEKQTVSEELLSEYGEQKNAPKTADPAAQNDAAEIYVSSTGNDEGNNGTKDLPFAMLTKAVGAAADGATIYVMSNLTMDQCARFYDKSLKITSGEDGPFTITRSADFNQQSDTARSWYNPAMIEVQSLSASSVGLTLSNIVLDDAGMHEGSVFAQAVSGGGNADNRIFVQDAIIASNATVPCTVTLGSGAVLRNFGGMSAVRVTEKAKLVMESGSKIEDTTVTDRVKGPSGSVGPAGAIWVQGASITMEKGSEISNIIGRAVYVDGGDVRIDGTITNIKADTDMWENVNGTVLHLRNSAIAEFSGVAEKCIGGALVITDKATFNMKKGALLGNSDAAGIKTNEDPKWSDVDKADFGTDRNIITINGEITGIQNSKHPIQFKYGTLTIGESGYVHDNAANYGALYIQRDAVVHIYGKINNNVSAGRGGALGMPGHGFVTLYMYPGAEMKNNRSAKTGGGAMISKGTFTMYGGTISGNISGTDSANGEADRIGGGVFVRRGGQFIMKGGAIENNATTAFGGGVCFDASDDGGMVPKVELNAGTIKNNLMRVTVGDKYQITGDRSNDLAVTGKDYGKCDRYLYISREAAVGDKAVYFQTDSKTVTPADSSFDIRLGNTSAANVTALTNASHSMGWNDPLTTLWVQRDGAAALTIGGLKPTALPVYVLTLPVDETGKVLNASKVQVYEAQKTDTGDIDITLPDVSENGHAVAIVQPSQDHGTLIINGPETIEKNKTSAPYPVTYTVTYAMSESMKSIIERSADEAEYVLTIDHDIRLTGNPDSFNRESIQVTYSLPNSEFKAGDFLLASAMLKITVGGHDYIVPSNVTKTQEVETTYSLTTQVNGGHGTISASKAGLAAGSHETVVFTPDSGYKIDTVTVNGVKAEVRSNTLEVIMDADKTVIVTYKGSTVKPSDQPDKSGKTASSNTGDSSNPVLWSALLFISGGAVIGTTVVSRKKKYNR